MSDPHPRGLYVLFFTEMWERFSYYGMRALLVLFLVAQVHGGGMGLSDKVATAVYGLYTAGAYLAALPGGWIADRLLGARRAVWYGGWLIAVGQFLLAAPVTHTFYPGLILLALGTGLLKPNVSAIVGQLYPEGGSRRDAGFTIFYMGINLGALLGPLVCSALGEKVNWRYGFAAAGTGMLLGLLQYGVSARHLGDAGLWPAGTQDQAARQKAWTLLGLGLAVLVVVIGLGLGGVLPIDPVFLADGAIFAIAATALLYFLYLFLWGGLDAAGRMRLAVVAILFLSSMVFWVGLEQAGSSLNLFAKEYTLRTIVGLGFEVPAGWLQSLGAIFVILLAPPMAALWLALARQRLDPPIAVKFGLGLLLLGAGFLVMAGAATLVASGQKVLPTWLVLTYLLHSIGELALSPVGLSSVTKLAPQRLVGQMMGLWFLATSLGNLIAGRIAGLVSTAGPDQMPARYLSIVLAAGACGSVMFLLSAPIKRLMADVR
jgi:POT family proton-dependent oligopeptide transporter